MSGEGEPLGLLSQFIWNRKQRRGKKEKRSVTPIEQKESYRWIATLAAVERELAGQEQVVHIGDREADIFELFAHPRADNRELLIRARHNRKLSHELGKFIPTLEQAPVLGAMSLQVQRNPKRAARIAQLQVRAMAVTLEVPSHHLKAASLEPVRLNAIFVEETVPPDDGAQPIRWVLLTSLPVESFEQVCQCIRWYSYRWLIERFHFTLKSGCGIEQLQLQSYERLLKALATYNVVAWRLMWLTYRARLTPQASCELVLQPAEWRLLRRKFVPKSRSQKPPTLQQAMLWIARLGGFLARKGDGNPGLKTLWRGLTKLHHLLEGAQLASQS
ncbi:IS4 family transposase [Synechococcus sp. PCC 7336]|uniref:IS4 family transposase n=1 Tax=Synechococcus sp. PCC 7336 TaxID=195250 RepID=UPI000345541B|nr:IS4 family transposase [Synechococcus sp. PCC 7336]